MTLETVVEAANNFGDTREGAGAGPLALAVVALLAIATILLWRNMTARIKRLPASFPAEKSDRAAAPAASAAPATPAESAGTAEKADEASAEPAAAEPVVKRSTTES
ncbi:hypothetical protein [Cryptosporangium arvum]|uniref:hypothetical protein n=1 Tax=Cryptosporangium arvum TaxID=80871 RepID=UPI0004AE105B|nr:hypothetical protein [Cryptosporangium arvum]